MSSFVRISGNVPAAAVMRVRGCKDRHQAIRLACADPGAFTPRGNGYGEELEDWQARAVPMALEIFDGAHESRPEGPSIDRRICPTCGGYDPESPGMVALDGYPEDPDAAELCGDDFHAGSPVSVVTDEVREGAARALMLAQSSAYTPSDWEVIGQLSQKRLLRMVDAVLASLPASSSDEVTELQRFSVKQSGQRRMKPDPEGGFYRVPEVDRLLEKLGPVLKSGTGTLKSDEVTVSRGSLRKVLRSLYLARPLDSESDVGRAVNELRAALGEGGEGK